MKLAILVFVGLLLLGVAYILFARPLLERAGIVRALPVAAATWRDRIAVFFRRSLTMLWAWLVGACGTAISLVLGLISDESFKAQLALILTPERMAYALIGIGVITGLVRLRTAVKG